MSQAVERAIAILEMLSAGPRRPADVAEALAIHRTTALRLMQDLERGGLARHREDGTFAVGHRLAGLAQAALDQFDLRGLGHNHLVSLAAVLGATVHLATIDGDRVVYVDKVEPHGTVRLYSEVGKPVRLHASGIGKAILAFAPETDRARLLHRYVFERFTPTTVVGAEAFRAHLAAIRARGWAVDDGEYESFVNCVAVPVKDSTGAVRTAISVTALRAQTDLHTLEARLPEVRRTATAIARELGWVE